MNTKTFTTIVVLSKGIRDFNRLCKSLELTRVKNVIFTDGNDKVFIMINDLHKSRGLNFNGILHTPESKLLPDFNDNLEALRNRLKTKQAQESYNSLTPTEKQIATAPIDLIISEYKLIQKKRSNQSSNIRKLIVLKCKFLLENGSISESDLND